MKRLLLLLCLFNKLSAQTSPNPSFELYILAGQSNMAGRGPLTDSLKAMGSDSLFSFSKEQQWVPAHHPLHFDKPAIVGAGPGLAFGIEMCKAKPHLRIGLIPCAVGGTPIEHWLPGAYDSATNTHPWDDALARIKAAMQYGVIKGIIWHQGEANSNPAAAAKYIEQLSEFITRVRKLVGNPRLPFVAGELGYFFTSANNINTVLQTLPSTVPFTAVASAANLTDKGDHLHFDAASANELGKRYAAKMLVLQKR
ncbi:MAG: sialate O-acetylesterase [Chitinophagaceae bacterium]